MGLSEAELGLALVGVPTGVFAGSLLVSGVIERRGTRATLLAALPLFAIGLVLASLAIGTATLFAALMLFGFSLTSCNVTMNVEADRVEAATGRRFINRSHAVWAVGFLAASLIGTAVVAAGVPPTVHFLGMLAVTLAITVTVVLPMQESPPRAHRGSGPSRRFAVPTLGVLLIVGFIGPGVVLEGSSRNWSVIYLRDEFTAAAWVATLALPAFIGATIVGRFSADTLIDRFGPVRVAMVLSLVAFAGLGLVATAGSVPFTLAGFALVGLGISTAHPQSLSAAARLGDRPSSLNVAALSTIQTVIGFVTPPLFGLIASRYGIRTAFTLMLPLPLVAIWFARALAPRDGS